MAKTVVATCPYCGTKTKVLVNSLYNDSHLIVCDVLEGGCDRMFVVDIEVSMKTKSRKIEGEGMNND